MSTKLFGTDGIRGTAGQFPLDPVTVTAAGRALGRRILVHQATGTVLLGIDTRESGTWLAECFAYGLKHEGIRFKFAGILPTAGVAWLTRQCQFAAGVMISASHNPYRDNGIKIIDSTGYKLPDSIEDELEKDIHRLRVETRPGRVELVVDDELRQHYLDWLVASFKPAIHPSKPLHLVVDAAHGAAYNLAPVLFETLGYQCTSIGCTPQGTNINENCGALYIENSLRPAVLRSGADLGVAYDGDADRAIFVSSTGRVVDGDALLYVASRYLHARGQLQGRDNQPSVVATVMSNLALDHQLEPLGIKVYRTKVGDRYVIEKMLETGCNLGGEQSGHIVFHDYSTTGDGLVTTLRLLEILEETGATLDELIADFNPYPQLVRNVAVRAKPPLDTIPELQQAIRAATEKLNGQGRVLVRYSGTEPLVRIMVEGPEPGLISEISESLAHTFSKLLNSM